MAAQGTIYASEEKSNTLVDERAKRRIRYNKKAEERRIEQDAITRKDFLDQYPEWDSKKHSLFPRDRRVIELSYGLDEKNGNKVFSLAQIGVILGQEYRLSSISRQRVQQIKNRALKSLEQVDFSG